MSDSERLAKEKEILGFYISGHPLQPYRVECELFATHTVSQLGTWVDQPITLGVVITAIRRQIAKRSGAEFARLTVEDFSGSCEVLVFPEAWGVIADRVKTDVPVLIRGGYSRRDQGTENPTLIVESIEPFAEKRLNGDAGRAHRSPGAAGSRARPAGPRRLVSKSRREYASSFCPLLPPRLTWRLPHWTSRSRSSSSKSRSTS
jgi:DNA polymerase-3 subunit alpha